MKRLLRSSKYGWRRVAAIVVSTWFLVLASWVLTYPPDSDHKGIQYVLWKSGVYNMNADQSLGRMVGDPKREKRVVGKTKEPLQQRFGYWLTLAEASPDWQGCYRASDGKGRDVLFISSSPWMVVFDGNRATDLVLIQGC